MPAVGLLPALSLIAGVAAGLALPWGWQVHAWLLIPAVVAAAMFWARGWLHLTTLVLVVGFTAAGAAGAAHARDAAIRTPLRHVLDAEFGGFDLDSLGPGGAHAPLLTRGRILEDASQRDGFVGVRVDVSEVKLQGAWRAVRGGVTLSVSGTASAPRAAGWTAGRLIEAPVTFRRPTRYLDDGIPDVERDLALDGTTLLGSVKSGLLVERRGNGNALDEAAARVRARVRLAIARWVGSRSATSGAITTAVLIGDRAAIPDDVRDRLQAAGTYHVIAISGGNIAVFALLMTAMSALAGLSPRRAAVVTIGALALYAGVVVSGPSVRRAVIVAAVYLLARALDHRATAWHAAGIAASLMLVLWPLDLRDPGFVLTFGAAGALLAAARRTSDAAVRRASERMRTAPPAMSQAAIWRWVPEMILASLAVEIALLPVQAIEFSRVTVAGVVLNLVAVPMMTLVQVGGLLVVAVDACGWPASAAGWVADAAARAIVGSAAWADLLPLTRRVPPPHLLVVLAYYTSIAWMWLARGRSRMIGVPIWCGAALVVGLGLATPLERWPAIAPGSVRLTVFDVGQGESMLLETRTAAPLLIDAGGAPFGSTFDIGTRVVAPALWARGVRALAALAVTHGDPDHLGGALGVIDSVALGSAWFGIQVPGHAPGELVLGHLAERRLPVRYLRAGDLIAHGGMRLRVLHPPEPDWERRRVRNDDSIVLEATIGDVAVLLTGDISAEVERAIVPLLSRARIRILKVAHHGSRTSTSDDLLQAWRPQLALVSAGRGNSFGHPTPEVLSRLDSARVRLLRTDRHGQITIDTDGRAVAWKTFTGARGSF